jgi:hypothetical protein
VTGQVLLNLTQHLAKEFKYNHLGAFFSLEFTHLGALFLLNILLGNYFSSVNLYIGYIFSPQAEYQKLSCLSKTNFNQPKFFSKEEFHCSLQIINYFTSTSLAILCSLMNLDSNFTALCSFAEFGFHFQLQFGETCGTLIISPSKF